VLPWSALLTLLRKAEVYDFEHGPEI
jgi:hypothetical protein